MAPVDSVATGWNVEVSELLLSVIPAVGARGYSAEHNLGSLHFPISSVNMTTAMYGNIDNHTIAMSKVISTDQPTTLTSTLLGRYPLFLHRLPSHETLLLLFKMA